MDSTTDLIVGIDVGMSCTGVAFINLCKSKPDSSKVRTISRWEGKVSESKVPTIVSYDKFDIAKGPTSWGFNSKTETEQGNNRLVGQWFKKRFDPRNRRSESSTLCEDDDEPIETGLPDVETLYLDFLSRLYNHIRNTFSNSGAFGNGATWETASVEFIFSVPATWEPETINNFLSIAEKAGFGSYKHRIGECLTEPQAVAVFAMKEEDKVGETGQSILIVDAGGGTADLCLVKIVGKESDRTNLCERMPVEGGDIGATYIDAAFEALALSKLKEIGHQRLGLRSEKSLDPLAWRMMESGDFLNYKHRLGAAGSENHEDDHFYVKIPVSLPGQATDAWPKDLPNLTETGEMIFQWRELMEIFNDQSDRIKDLIDTMIDELKLMRESNIDHVIFSGGLGGSPYIQDRLRKQFGDGTALEKTVFHASSLPQLCVCKGLVMNRIEELKSGTSIFTKYCARISIGVRKWEKFDRFKLAHRRAKKEHIVEIRNNMMLVPYVEWLIQRGKPYDSESPVYKDANMRFASTASDASLHGRISIVSSSKKNPPKFGKDHKEIGRLLFNFSNLSKQNLHTRHGHLHNKVLGQQAYKQVNFVLSARLGPADVKIDCLSSKLDGVKLNRDAAIPIEVDTQEVRAAEVIAFE